MRIRTNVEEFAEGHTQALVKVVVDLGTSSDPLGASLQQV